MAKIVDGDEFPILVNYPNICACPLFSFKKNGSSGSCVLRRNLLPRGSFPTSSIGLSIRRTDGRVRRAFSEQRKRSPPPNRAVSIRRSHTRQPLTIAGKWTSYWSVGLCWRATRSNEGEGHVFRWESWPFRFMSLPFVLKTRPWIVSLPTPSTLQSDEPSILYKLK